MSELNQRENEAMNNMYLGSDKELISHTLRLSPLPNELFRTPIMTTSKPHQRPHPQN
jgi:hypothetical protein